MCVCVFVCVCVCVCVCVRVRVCVRFLFINPVSWHLMQLQLYSILNKNSNFPITTYMVFQLKKQKIDFVH